MFWETVLTAIPNIFLVRFISSSRYDLRSHSSQKKWPMRGTDKTHLKTYTEISGMWWSWEGSWDVPFSVGGGNEVYYCPTHITDSIWVISSLSTGKTTWCGTTECFQSIKRIRHDPQGQHAWDSDPLLTFASSSPHVCGWIPHPVVLLSLFVYVFGAFYFSGLVTSSLGLDLHALDLHALCLHSTQCTLVPSSG